MSDQTPSGEVPIILPTPVVVNPHKESKLAIGTRFLAWLTATLLAVSVLVALISVTSERNDLRTQLNQTNSSLVCRAAAGVRVNQAIVDEQIAISNHSVAVGEFIAFIIRVPNTDPTYIAQITVLADNIDQIDNSLSSIAIRLQTAVDDQQKALLDC